MFFLSSLFLFFFGKVDLLARVGLITIAAQVQCAWGEGVLLPAFAEAYVVLRGCLQVCDLRLAMTQGGLDGGLDIPHGDKRFVGYDTEAKKLDTEQLKKYILGGHVSP